VKHALENETTAGRGDDDKIHEDHHGVVTPAICAVFSPETCMPFEKFFLDGAEHDQNEADCGEFGENTEDHAERAGALRDTEEKRKIFAHFDVFAADFGIGDMFPTARKKNEPYH